MIHLNLDPTPVAKGDIVELTPEASITSLGEIRVGRRRFQVRRSTNLVDGQTQEYLVGPKPVSFATMGPAYFLERVTPGDAFVATSRETGNPLRTGGAPARFRFEGDTLVLA